MLVLITTVLAQGEQPLLVSEKESRPAEKQRRIRADGKTKSVKTRPDKLKSDPDVEMCRFRLEVGYRDDVKPGNILGAVANEADIDSRYIGSIDIYDEFSTIDLPAGMPKETFEALKKTRVCGKALRISELSETGRKSAPHKRKPKGKGKHKPTALKPGRKRAPKSKKKAKARAKTKKPMRQKGKQ